MTPGMMGDDFAGTQGGLCLGVSLLGVRKVKITYDLRVLHHRAPFVSRRPDSQHSMYRSEVVSTPAHE
jgi:hypothetical protein